MKKIIILFLAISMLLIHVLAEAIQPLSVDRAFAFSALAKDNQTIVLQWHITPGYYLYRDNFNIHAINPHDTTLAAPILPQNYVEKIIPTLGHFSVYKHSIYIIQPIISSTENAISLFVHYQGCSEQGFCYPPVSKIVTMNLADNNTITIQSDDVRHTTTASPKNSIETVLASNSLWKIVITFFALGILISLTPCILPMLPILSSVIVGQHNPSRRHSFLLSLSYVLGMALTYAIAGIITVLIGVNIQTAFQQPWLIILFTLIFIAMALSLFDFYQLQLPLSWRTTLARASDHQKHGSLIGTFLIGVFSTLILSPCVTPALVVALTYISQTKNLTTGGLALFFMGLGQGLPLLLIGIFGAHCLPKAGKWMIVLKNIMGLLMLAVAIWMISRILPSLITGLLWSLLIVGTGLLMVKNHKFTGILFMIAGITVGVYIFLSKESDHKSSLHFITITNSQELHNQLNAATAFNKPILLDFYATWCVSCKEMDLFTFSHPDVQSALKNMVLLRADVTRNGTEEQALEKQFGVIAPPTVIFFDKNHVEMPQAKIIGNLSATPFLKHLTSYHITPLLSHQGK